MFINLHILTTIGYSNLNRDDTGAPKTCYYGGVQRARISSQALKRAKRIGFESELDGGETTYRSKFVAKNLENTIIAILKDNGITVDEETQKKVSSVAHKKTQNLTHKGKETSDDAEKEKGTLVWIAEKEILETAQKVAEEIFMGDADEDKDLIVTTPTTASLTIAAFGRMFAERPDLQTEASIQVGHAVTTHEAVTELDYFNAADDLRETYAGDKGAGHLDVAQYTSGEFYLPISIDVGQLGYNWSAKNDIDAKERLTKFVEHLLLDLPSGKQNSTAAKTAPSFLYAEISAQPLSYAGAFEAAVESDTQGGYHRKSVEALKENIRQAKKFIPKNQQGDNITVDGADSNSTTIDDLTEFVVTNIMSEIAE